MDTVLREAKAAHDALVSTASACDNWTSEQWPAKRKEGEAAIKAFHNEFAKLLRYNRSLDLAVTAKKSRDTKDKRNASARSKRVAQKMTERGVPSALADCIASFLEDKPKDTALTHFCRGTYNLRYDKDLSNVNYPLVFDHNVTNYWTDELKRSVDVTREDVARAIKKGTQKMVKEEIQFGSKLISVSKGVSFKPPLDAPMVLLEPVLSLYRACAMATDVDSVPILCLPTVATIVRGYAFVVFLEIDDMLTHGYEVERLSGYLDKVLDRGLDGINHCGLVEGDSFYVPLGYVAIAVYLNHQDQDDFEYGAHIAYPAMPEKPEGMSARVIAEAVARLTRATSHGLPAFAAPNGSRAKAWLKSLASGFAETPTA